MNFGRLLMSDICENPDKYKIESVHDERAMFVDFIKHRLVIVLGFNSKIIIFSWEEF